MAASAAEERIESGRPARSASLSIVSVVSSSASWFWRKLVNSPASFWFSSASFALSASESFAPRNVKFFQYSHASRCCSGVSDDFADEL